MGWPRSTLWTDVQIWIAFLRRDGKCTCTSPVGHHPGCFQDEVNRLEAWVDDFREKPSNRRDLRALRMFARKLVVLSYRVSCRCVSMPHDAHCAIRTRQSLEMQMWKQYGINVWYGLTVKDAIGLNGPVAGSREHFYQSMRERDVR